MGTIADKKIPGLAWLLVMAFGLPLYGEGMFNPADIDNSGRVDVVDFAVLSVQWQSDGGFVPSADIAPASGDGVVDELDLLVVAENWLQQSNSVTLLYDDFESGFGDYTGGGADSLLYTGGVYAHQGSNAVNIRANNGTASAFWLREGINGEAAGFTRFVITFWHRSEGMEYGDVFTFQYYNGTIWETVRTFQTDPIGLTEGFETYAVGTDPTGWFDTRANNSLLGDEALFKIFEVAGQKAMGTTSTLTNIHSHYVNGVSASWTEYEYRGRMRIASATGGIGVTIFSDYPNSDRYYRLRRYNDGVGAFHISPHPNGTGISGGITNTGVVPTANIWYRFRVQAEAAADRTNIRAKVWPEGTAEPANWQGDCYDASATRMTAGTVGIWAMGTGQKYWDDLETVFVREDNVGYFENGQFYFESVELTEAEYVFPANMNFRFQCQAGPDDDNVYIDEVQISASGGRAVVVRNMPESAFEQPQTPGRWIIEAVGSESSGVPVNFHVSGIEGELHGAASPGDYELRDVQGNLVSSPVTIGAAGVFEILLYPLDDGVAEPPEEAVLTVEPGPYAIMRNDLPVAIYDAPDDPVDDRLLVAELLPADQVPSTASGAATIVINGSKTQALISCNFNSLTSIQTGSGMYCGDAQELQNGTGTVIFNLPPGQFSQLVWDITATEDFTIGEIIDALFGQNGRTIYLEVQTESYAGGEIRGPLIRQEGSVEFVPPDPPPAPEVLTGESLRRDVVRFLMQATFGPQPAEIDALYGSIVNTYSGDRMAGYEAWIDEQFALDQTRLATLLYYIDENEYAKEGLTRGGGVDFSNVTQTPTWVHWDLALQAHDQLRQRMAFALSEIVVVSKIGNEVNAYVHYAPENYWDMLAGHADGNYRDVLYDVSKSPVIGSYLSHLTNSKTVTDPQTGETTVSPDENYAREVMQLFAIGLVELHPDGTLRLNSSGSVMETYDNDDITELAKVFTGWGLSKQYNGAENNNFFLMSAGPPLNNLSWITPMKLFASYHETGAKTFLGATIPPGLDGEQDLQAAVDILFAHPNVAPFISRRLIQRLVTSNPSKGYVYRVAGAFEDDGTGIRGNLQAVIKAILLDYEARSLTLVDDPLNHSFGKVKEPIIAFIQMCRAFNMSPDPNSTDAIVDLAALGYPADQADNFPPGGAVIGKQGQSSSFDFGFGFDQRFMSAPSVFNYYQPDYSAGQEIQAAALFSPELQIADAYTLAVRHREMWEKLYYTTRDWPIDLAQFQQIYEGARAGGATAHQGAEVLVDQLDLLLTGGSLRADYANAPLPNPRSIIIDTVAAQSDALHTGKALTAPYLIVTSPAFQVQR